jgi:hypothetical protein
MKRVIIPKVLLLLAMVFCCAEPTLACLCNPLSPKKAFSRAKSTASAIFVGQAVEVVNGFSSGLFRGWRIKFQVLEYWKGQPKETTVIFTGPSNCAAHFEVGQKYLVFASWSENGNDLVTSVCMQTGRLDMSTYNLKRLGKGKVVSGETVAPPVTPRQSR